MASPVPASVTMLPPAGKYQVGIEGLVALDGVGFPIKPEFLACQVIAQQATQLFLAEVVELGKKGLILVHCCAVSPGVGLVVSPVGRRASVVVIWLSSGGGAAC